MDAFITRILTIPVGIVFVIASALDVAGLVPHSGAMPPLGERLRHSLPIGIGFAALLVPYRRVSSRRSRMILRCILFLFAAWVCYLSIEGAAGYVSGQKSWHVLPASWALLCLVAGNLWAFVRITDTSGRG
jgi:hypothetical protein